jgi:hypothetical protein
VNGATKFGEFEDPHIRRRTFRGATVSNTTVSGRSARRLISDRRGEAAARIRPLWAAGFTPAPAESAFPLDRVTMS